jgi:hypothetical protein
MVLAVRAMMAAIPIFLRFGMVGFIDDVSYKLKRKKTKSHMPKTIRNGREWLPMMSLEIFPGNAKASIRKNAATSIATSPRGSSMVRTVFFITLLYIFWI